MKGKLFYDYRESYHPFLQNCMTSSLWIRPLIEQLRAPFLEIPRHYIGSSYLSYGVTMALGFRIQLFLVLFQHLAWSFQMVRLIHF
jgi:hypothetical protein